MIHRVCKVEASQNVTASAECLAQMRLLQDRILMMLMLLLLLLKLLMPGTADLAAARDQVPTLVAVAVAAPVAAEPALSELAL